MTCNHSAHFKWLRRIATVELGSSACPTCGQKVRFPATQVTLGNVILLLGFAASAALSIKLRSWWPYFLLFVFYGIGRFWLVSKGRLVETTRPGSLTALWLLVLIVFIVVLTKFVTR
jgi:hypothetical protein